VLYLLLDILAITLTEICHVTNDVMTLLICIPLTHNLLKYPEIFWIQCCLKKIPNINLNVLTKAKICSLLLNGEITASANIEPFANSLLVSNVHCQIIFFPITPYIFFNLKFQLELLFFC